MTTETILTVTARAAFEAACAQHAEDAGYEGHERLARDGAGYADSHTQAAWWGWCAALQSPELQALRKDARRYRYLKKGNQWIIAATQTGFHVDGEELDELIDNEMEKQQ